LMLDPEKADCSSARARSRDPRAGGGFRRLQPAVVEDAIRLIGAPCLRSGTLVISRLCHGEAAPLAFPGGTSPRLWEFLTRREFVGCGTLPAALGRIKNDRVKTPANRQV